MTRDAWLVVAGAVLAAIGLVSWWRWPEAAPALPCDPQLVFLDDAGVARCGVTPGAALPAGQALTVGQKVPFDRLTAADLAILPGIGPELATAIIDARAARGGFCSWDEVDAVEGVGPARLQTLQTLAEIPRCDAGL
jgi:competence protein ComEA